MITGFQWDRSSNCADCFSLEEWKLHEKERVDDDHPGKSLVGNSTTRRQGNTYPVAKHFHLVSVHRAGTFSENE